MPDARKGEGILLDLSETGMDVLLTPLADLFRSTASDQGEQPTEQPVDEARRRGGAAGPGVQTNGATCTSSFSVTTRTNCSEYRSSTSRRLPTPSTLVPSTITVLRFIPRR